MKDRWLCAAAAAPGRVRASVYTRVHPRRTASLAGAGEALLVGSAVLQPDEADKTRDGNVWTRVLQLIRVLDRPYEGARRGKGGENDRDRGFPACLLRLQRRGRGASESGRAKLTRAVLDTRTPAGLGRQRGRGSSTLSPTFRTEKGLTVQVEVSSAGRAVAVEDLLDLCLTVGPDGKVLPQHMLSDDEKRCILKDLRAWRFAGVETCWPLAAYVHVGGARTAKTETAGECGGGPTTG